MSRQHLQRTKLSLGAIGAVSLLVTWTMVTAARGHEVPTLAQRCVETRHAGFVVTNMNLTLLAEPTAHASRRTNAAVAEESTVIVPPVASRASHQDNATSLHVTDQATGDPIQLVEIALGAPGGGAVGDVNWRLVERELSSPIALDQLDLLDGRVSGTRAGLRRYWVSAAGYAWNDVLVDHRRGAPTEIALRPGATLTVDVTGSAGDERLVLVPDVDDRALAAFERPIATDGRVVIGGVAPATYTLTVTAPRARGEALVVQRVLVPGQGASIALELPPLRAPGTTRLVGEIRLDEAWGEPNGRLLVRRAGEMKPIASKMLAALERDDAALRWDLGPVDSGEYELVLDAFSHRTSIVIEDEPPSETKVRLDVPAPARVLVRVVEHGSGAPAGSASLRWSLADGRSARRRARAVSGRPGTFTLLAPAGVVVLEATNGRAAPDRGRIVRDVSPGANEVVVELRPTATLEVSLRTAWGPLAWDARRHSARLTHRATGEERTIRSGSVSGLAPGTYDVTVDAGSEHAPAPTRTIVARSGRSTPVEVALVARMD